MNSQGATTTTKAQNITTTTVRSYGETTSTTVPEFKQVLFSEIQVAGSSANDEFIELYNPNIFPVYLKD
ncbi:MAG: hypothetical protein PHO23_02850 [Candidatus Pacebacteria bacterium]|nr:hypothetical protein [Candidatus Paceibacterota bacterium]